MSDKIIDFLKAIGIEKAMVIYTKDNEVGVTRLNTNTGDQLLLSRTLCALVEEERILPVARGLAKNFLAHAEKSGKA